MGKEKEQIKKELEIFKNRHGEPSKELKDYVKNINKINSLILKSLKEAPKTVLEISKEIDVPTQKVLRQLMALKKYGKIKEDVQEGDYFKYAILQEN